MKPSLKEQLKTWQRKHPEYTPRKKSTKEYRLPDYEIKNMMGVYMRTLQRGKGGA